MTFIVNGYRLYHLVEDPAAVQESLDILSALLCDCSRHMTTIGRDDLAADLDDLHTRLQRMGVAIDDRFDTDFRTATSAAAAACVRAAGPEGLTADRVNGPIYWNLVWGIVRLVTVRVGGIGSFEHPGT